MRACIVAILCLLVATERSSADPKVVRLTARPATAPVPALKYLLLPDLGQVHAGNAALLYQRAHARGWFMGVRRQPDYIKMSEWLNLAPDKVPWDRVRALLPGEALAELDQAARREYCDWQMVERLRQDGYSLALGDFQGFREYATILGMRARLEIHEDRLDKAAYTLQTGLALSRHTADAPTLINSLIAMAIADVMFSDIEEMIQAPGAPNLYWALTELPRPFIDLRDAFQAQKIMTEKTLPEIRAALSHPAAEPLTPGQLQQVMHRVRQYMDMSNPSTQSPPFLLAIAAAKVHPLASKHLLSRGFSKDQLNALPVVQVALMYALAEYDLYFDDLAKWVNLPYPESLPGLSRADQTFREQNGSVLDRGGIPLARYFLPAHQKVIQTRAWLDRRIAALRCIEAIRMHAAAHDGHLPPSLDAIKEVPVPVNPVTGKAFLYRVDNGKAVLFASPPAGAPAMEHNSVNYELTLRN